MERIMLSHVDMLPHHRGDGSRGDESFCRLGLLCGDGIEGCQQGAINSPCAIKYGSQNSLTFCGVGVVKERCGVRWWRILPMARPWWGKLGR